MKEKNIFGILNKGEGQQYQEDTSGHTSTQAFKTYLIIWEKKNLKYQDDVTILSVFNYLKKKDVKCQDDANDHTSTHTYKSVFKYFSYLILYFYIMKTKVNVRRRNVKKQVRC